jgi:hypothetical protein
LKADIEATTKQIETALFLENRLQMKMERKDLRSLFETVARARH